VFLFLIISKKSKKAFTLVEEELVLFKKIYESNERSINIQSNIVDDNKKIIQHLEEITGLMKNK
jgi:hypothetical protein